MPFTFVVVVLALGWLVPLVLLIRGFGGRPWPDRFLEVNGLAQRTADGDHVGRILRRTYRARVVGGVVGLVIGLAVSIRLGPELAIGSSILGLLMGSMIGMTAAQSGWAIPDEHRTSQTRSASLVARRAVDYLPRPATALTMILAAIVLGFGTLVLLSAESTLGLTVLLFAVGFATLAVVPIGRRLQRRTIELQRDPADPQSLRVDDALRACAVRGLHHASLGVLFCGLLLLGYGARATQTFVGARIDHRVVFRAPPLSRITASGTTQTPVGAGGYEETDRISWTEPGGRSRSRSLRVHGPRVGSAAPILEMGLLVDDATLVGLGTVSSVIGSFGALIQWSRAARSWRKPQRAPALVPRNITPVRAGP